MTQKKLSRHIYVPTHTFEAEILGDRIRTGTRDTAGHGQETMTDGYCFHSPTPEQRSEYKAEEHDDYQAKRVQGFRGMPRSTDRLNFDD